MGTTEIPTQVAAVSPTPVQFAATCAQMAKQTAVAAAVQPVTCAVIAYETWPDIDIDLGICVICEVGEQMSDDVWIFSDTRSAVTVCPCEFQEDMYTKDDVTGPKCEAAKELQGRWVVREMFH